ncbi:MAG: hypothetical protein WKF37_02655 [Bryobacteraceae bacterium]
MTTREPSKEENALSDHGSQASAPNARARDEPNQLLLFDDYSRRREEAQKEVELDSGRFGWSQSTSASRLVSKAKPGENAQCRLVGYIDQD